MKKIAKIRLVVILIPLAIVTVAMVKEDRKVESKKETTKTEIALKYDKSYYRRVHGFKK